MKFITETRLKLLEDMVRLLPEREDRSYALHLIDSLRGDIEANYAEIRLAYTLRGQQEEERTAIRKRRKDGNHRTVLSLNGKKPGDSTD